VADWRRRWTLQSVLFFFSFFFRLFSYLFSVGDGGRCGHAVGVDAGQKNQEADLVQRAYSVHDKNKSKKKKKKTGPRLDPANGATATEVGRNTGRETRQTTTRHRRGQGNLFQSPRWPE
jgi:hypothetical protein